MSFEGYYQMLCVKGHAKHLDCHEEKPEWCECGALMVWENLVDVTNGSYDDGLRIDGYVELEVEEESFCTCCGHLKVRTYKIPPVLCPPEKGWQPNLWTIEGHGDGFALYQGRTPQRHGLNLVHLSEPDANWESTKKLIEAAPVLLESLIDTVKAVKELRALSHGSTAYCEAADYADYQLEKSEKVISEVTE
jgi:hypothetical protein